MEARLVDGSWSLLFIVLGVVYLFLHAVLDFVVWRCFYGFCGWGGEFVVGWDFLVVFFGGGLGLFLWDSFYGMVLGLRFWDFEIIFGAFEFFGN